ncbi:hypothetical protein F406_gp022 [Agrobacterium phage 7-7-1]|uniref:Putative membrane protein n=1 Tax=Agrobacterium phage 7-7-1 TaxID=1161931 RepID=J7FAR9_9CAUD|nr:hypothetical protein F406_gp022 [Agrobacterium phage 7-7-1]AFH19793.1 putative membrane protein [Agrobacterium phage 7-7-1]
MIFIFILFISGAVGTLAGGAVYGCLTFGILGFLVLATSKWIDWQ